MATRDRAQINIAHQKCQEIFAGSENRYLPALLGQKQHLIHIYIYITIIYQGVIVSPNNPNNPLCLSLSLALSMCVIYAGMATCHMINKDKSKAKGMFKLTKRMKIDPVHWQELEKLRLMMADIMMGVYIYIYIYIYVPCVLPYVHNIRIHYIYKM